MLISRAWLQTFFDTELPSAADLATGLTNHAFEIEEVRAVGDDTVLDVKVLPNRAHDCFCHYGVAKEVSAIFNIPLTRKPFEKKLQTFPESNAWTVEVATSKVKRFHGAVVRGVKVKESPKWLRERIEAMGGRSINNVVDITNFVMFDIGQPMHAFDAKKLSEKEGGYKFVVRESAEGEKTQTLDGAERVIPSGVLLITDGNTDGKNILGIGGIKGGMSSSITEDTTDIILEAANFDAETIRRGSKLLDVRTDASKRFENGLAPELPGYAVAYAIELLEKEARGENFVVEGAVDYKDYVEHQYKLGVSTKEINTLLGTELKESEVDAILKRLGLSHKKLVVEEALRNAIPATLSAAYRRDSSMRVDPPRFFSCSSLVSYLYVEAGIYMPSYSVDKYVFSDRVEKENLAYGDLVFANTGEGKIYYESVQFIKGTKVPEGVDHVGMYVGEGKILHATKSKNGVVVEDLATSDQFKNIIGYGRVADQKETRFLVEVPFERLDVRIKEDLIDEIGRIYGLEHIPSILPNMTHEVEVNKEFYYLDKIRTTLTEAGFSEVYTYAMVEHGEVELQNPIAGNKNFMRQSLIAGLRESQGLNTYNAPLLGLSEVKLFEIGKVFGNNKEHLSLAIDVFVPNFGKKGREIEKQILEEVRVALKMKVGIEINDGQSTCETNLTDLLDKLPEISAIEFSRSPDIAFKTFSSYPFILRDIAIFVPETITSNEVSKIIVEHAGPYFVRIDQFDEFRKEGRVSYAYHLVFQAMDKTLTDEEINVVMQSITDTLNANANWQVR
jgi:phenylalanyl-tRNA synthetase beta subunit